MNNKMATDENQSVSEKFLHIEEISLWVTGMSKDRKINRKVRKRVEVVEKGKSQEEIREKFKNFNYLSEKICPPNFLVKKENSLYSLFSGRCTALIHRFIYCLDYRNIRGKIH